jgi:hypothetical protein
MGGITLNIEFPDSFKQLVEQFPCKGPGPFIGIGNPNADILIVGKEMAIDMSDGANEFDKKLYATTVEGNIDLWKKNIANEPKIVIPSWFEDNEKGWSRYNPLYPFYGQITNKTRTNGGTSTTEKFYQKFISKLVPEHAEDGIVDFHLHAFTTELSTAVARKSKDVDPSKRRDSINNREKLWKTPFFRKFPITILAVGHYPRENHIDIRKAFDVEFQGPTHVIGDGRNKLFINKHISADGRRLLLHTNQFSCLQYRCKEYVDNFFDTILKMCQGFNSYQK